MRYNIICTSCGNQETKSINACSLCLGSLETIYPDQKKFENFLPLEKTDIKKYPNSITPIISVGKNVFAKLEYCSLSASSKDREAFVEILMAKKLKYRGIIAASTGNMGGALATMSGILKLPCTILIPKDTSKSKVNQIKNFGATVEAIDGLYDEMIPLAKKMAKENNFFLASLQAFRFDGYKTISYEIFQKFGNNLPENIVIPLGDATTYVGVWKGFMELKSCGLIKKCPRLIGVQSENCSPIVDAFKNKGIVKPIRPGLTLAKAIRIGDPLDGNYAIKVAKITGGDMFKYSDKQIKEAYSELLKAGINAEYTSAATYCPIMYNNLKNSLLLITGSGLKN